MAFSDIIGRLSVNLSMDTAAFTTSSKKAGRDADILGDRMEKLGRRVGSAVKLFVVAAAVGGLATLAKAGFASASALGEQATQLGVTTTALQEYRFAAGQVGISSAELDKGLAQLTRRIGEAANGNKSLAQVFKDLGVSVKDASGNVLNAADAIPKIADAFEKVKSPAERAALAADLFGAKLGGKFLTLLDGGSRAVNQLREDAHELGVVLSEEQIQNADKTADKLESLYNVLGTRIAGVVADNSEAIYNLADAIASVTSNSLKFIKEYPRLAAALAGAAVGARAGLPGAIVGAGAGTVAGDVLGNRADDANSDLRFRIKQLDNATAAQKRLVAASKPGGGSLFRIRRGTAGGTLTNSTAEVRRQTKLLRAATAASRAPATPSAAAIGADITQGLSPKADKAKKARGSKGKSAADIERSFENDLLSVTARILSARESAATNANDRAEFQLRALEFDRLIEKRDIAANEDFTAIQKAELLAANENLAEYGREAIERERRNSLEQEANDITGQINDGLTQRLGFQISLADTDGERQRLALETLDAEQAFQRGALERVISSDLRSDAERALAQTALDQLNASAPLARAAATRATETRVQAFGRSLSKTPGQMIEAFNDIKIDGLDRLNEGLVQAITGVKSLGAVFKDIAGQIVADLLRIAIRQTIVKGLASLLNLGGLGGGATGGGGTSVSVAGARALGGPVNAGSAYLVGERGRELFVPGQSGRIVSNDNLANGGRTRIDVIPSPFFQVAVNGQIQRAAPALVGASVAEVGQRQSRAQSRRVG